MIELLKIEYLKVKNYTTFWVICLLYVAIVPLIFIGLCDALAGFLVAPFGPPFETYLSFPAVWNNVVYTASWLNLLLGVLVVVLTANEMTYRTQRQHIIEGVSRKNVIFSKMLFLVVFAAAVSLYTFILGFICGAIYSDIVDFYNGIEAIGLYFVQTTGYFAIAFLLTVLLQRTALSIIIYILLFIVDLFVPAMVGDVISQFLPVTVISDLTPFPFLEGFLAQAAEQDPNFREPIILEQYVRTIISTVYIVLFALTGYLILKKRDI